MKQMDLKINTILLTGYSGFVGSYLLQSLINKNYYIYCLGRKEPLYFPSNVSFIKQDFNQIKALKKIPDDIDCVIHLAAIFDKTHNNIEMLEVNSTSTLHLLEYGRESGIKKFIFSSTGGVYGYSYKTHKEMNVPKPFNFYNTTKYLSELMIKNYANCFHVNILRLFFPYGICQRKGIIPFLIYKILNGEPIIIYNDDTLKINPIYIENLVEIINNVITMKNSETFNLSGDEIISIGHLSELIGSQLKIKPKFEHLNTSEIKSMIGDNKKIKKYCNISKFTPIKKNLSQILKQSKIV